MSRGSGAPFEVVPGVPGIRAEIDRLARGVRDGTLDADDRRLAGKLFKTIAHLSRDPFHPGLHSHEVSALTARFGARVFQSYLENRTPGAGRLYWTYGPARRMITLIGMEPHPEDDKRSGYRRVEFSRLPSVDDVRASPDSANPRS